MSFGTQFISLLAPPGDAIKEYNRSLPSSEQPSSIPRIFLEAMSIREEVFVKEQGVPLENELDADDPRSFHWVAYASVGTTHSPEPSSRSENIVDSAGSGSGSPTHGRKLSREERKEEERRKSEPSSQKVAVGCIRLVPPPHPPHPEPGSHHKIDNAEDPPRQGSLQHQSNSHNNNNNTSEQYIKLGRLAVLPSYRGLGLSRLLVKAALDWAADHPDQVVPSIDPVEVEKHELEGKYVPEPWRGLVLVHAQRDIEALWQRMGFVRDEKLGEWDEEGILHCGMWKRVRGVKERPVLGFRKEGTGVADASPFRP